MAGVLLQSGQVWVVDQMKAKIDSLGGLYVGLMTNSVTPNETNQIGNGINELDPTPGGGGYSRQFVSTWTVNSGVDPTLSGSAATFEVEGVWENTNGYFVSITANGSDALWAEVFPVEKQGDKHSGDRIIIIPIYEQKDDNE